MPFVDIMALFVFTFTFHFLHFTLNDAFSLGGFVGSRFGLDMNYPVTLMHEKKK
jgi:hypothetical protein